MNMWSKTAKHQSLPSRPSNNRILALFLVFALIGGTFGGVASAAEEVTSIDLLDSSSSTPPSIIQLYVEHETVSLRAYANITGGTVTRRDVTEDAVWTSSSSSIKVNKGALSATGVVSSATITVKYMGYTTSFGVKADFLYDELKLKNSGTAADASMNIDLGTVLNLTAWVSKEGGTELNETEDAQWTTSNSSVATVADGTVTLLTAGTVTITAKYKGKSDTIALTVRSPFTSIDIKNESGGSIEGSIEKLIGEGVTNLQAIGVVRSDSSVLPDSTTTATWTSSNTTVVKVEEGKVTIVGVGTAIVTAKRFGISDAVTFIVRAPYEVLQVTPDKPIAITLYSPKVQVTATAYKGTTSLGEVTTDSATEWKVADPSVAGMKTENSKVYIEPKGVGTTKVTVSYKGLSKEISISVFPTINTVEISKDSVDAFVDDTAALPEVSGITLSGDTKDISKLVQWSTDAEGKDVVSIEDGKWKALKIGKAVLTATIENESGILKTDSFTIEVHNKVLIMIPSTDTMSVVIGKEVDLPTVQLIYENGEEAPISDKIVWKSSTTNLLVKSAKMKGLLPATATLTGTYLNKTVKIKVTVEEEFTSFLIAPTKVSLTLNKSQTIKVTGTTKSGKIVTLSSRIDWSASTPEHLTIKGASVKGLAEGSGKLTATIQGKSLEIPYTVTAKLSKLTASSNSFQPAVGDQVSVELTALYENGKTANVTALAVWTTSKAAVATVIDGKIKAIGKGSAMIKATFGGKTVTIRISVK